MALQRDGMTHILLQQDVDLLKKRAYRAGRESMRRDAVGVCRERAKQHAKVVGRDGQGRRILAAHRVEADQCADAIEALDQDG